MGCQTIQAEASCFSWGLIVRQLKQKQTEKGEIVFDSSYNQAGY